MTWSKGQRVRVQANPLYLGDTSQKHVGATGTVQETHDYPKVKLDCGFVCLCCHPDSLVALDPAPEASEPSPKAPPTHYLPTTQDQLTLAW